MHFINLLSKISIINHQRFKCNIILQQINTFNREQKLYVSIKKNEINDLFVESNHFPTVFNVANMNFKFIIRAEF